MANYYSIKLNVPLDQEEAIRSLIPDGAPVSGTLTALLYNEAIKRGFSVPDDVRERTLQKQIDNLRARLTTVENRLDYMTRRT